MQGFIGQEAMHSQAHSGVVDHFDAQGVDVTAFTNQIRWLFEKLLGRVLGGARDDSTAGC